ncbi:MAG: hypothetical protein AAF458_07065 [Pseudomonadota bacterium]
MTVPTWPATQNFLTAEERDEKAAACLPAFRAACANMQIQEDLSALIASHYLPLSAWLEQLRGHLGRPLVVGLTGGQGSGKSTVSALLSTVLEHAFGARAVPLSIDDLYLTHAERQQLGRDVHPLLATRGPPGTHDVALGQRVIAQLPHLCAQSEMTVPAFDKATDDRLAAEHWPVVSGPVDFVLFEGWCVNATATDEASLEPAINQLETNEDQAQQWRRYVNDALAGPYRALFDRIDVQIMLNVGSMDRVFEWRELQERKLRERVKAAGQQLNLRVMDPDAVVRFIHHYERITRRLLAEMPETADIVFAVDEQHNPAEVRINRVLDVG